MSQAPIGIKGPEGPQGPEGPVGMKCQSPHKQPKIYRLTDINEINGIKGTLGPGYSGNSPYPIGCSKVTKYIIDLKMRRWHYNDILPYFNIECGMKGTRSNYYTDQTLFFRIFKDPSYTTIIKEQIHTRNEYGENILLFALRHRVYDCIQLLLDLGVDLHACDNKGNNALMHIIINRGEFANLYAKDHGLSYIKLFLESGMDIDHRNNDGFTAFDLAEQDDMVRELLLSYNDLCLVKPALD
jgi:hypothetical protein